MSKKPAGSAWRTGSDKAEATRRTRLRIFLADIKLDAHETLALFARTVDGDRRFGFAHHPHPSLIDTNIIFEVRKGARCDARVSASYASIADEDLFLSTLVLGEIRKGVELARLRDTVKAAVLERWLREVEAAFGGRVLGIDNAVADQWNA